MAKSHKKNFKTLVDRMCRLQEAIKQEQFELQEEYNRVNDTLNFMFQDASNTSTLLKRIAKIENDDTILFEQMEALQCAIGCIERFADE